MLKTAAIEAYEEKVQSDEHEKQRLVEAWEDTCKQAFATAFKLNPDSIKLTFITTQIRWHDTTRLVLLCTWDNLTFVFHRCSSQSNTAPPTSRVALHLVPDNVFWDTSGITDPLYNHTSRRILNLADLGETITQFEPHYI